MWSTPAAPAATGTATVTAAAVSPGPALPEGLGAAAGRAGGGQGSAGTEPRVRVGEVVSGGYPVHRWGCSVFLGTSGALGYPGAVVAAKSRPSRKGLLC